MNKHFLQLSFLLCLLISGFSYKASATHLNGAEISYKCTANAGIYEVTLIVYRRCNEPSSTAADLCASFACTVPISIIGADPSCNGTVFLNTSLALVSVRDVDINTAQCPSSKNTCTNLGTVTAGTYTPSVERYEFKSLVNLGQASGIPTSCCNLEIVWTNCCRSSYISSGAADQGFYISATINRCPAAQTPCNSSPVFKNDPFSIICGNESFVFNNGAVDPDLDSLTYSFAPALQAAGSSVTYLPPLAYNRPMIWGGGVGGPPEAAFPGGIRCDSANGDIMFTPPNGLGGHYLGVVCVEVKQWKTINGIPSVIGITRRDIMMTVRGDCLANNPPTFTTTPPADPGNNPIIPKTVWQIRAGNKICFNIKARDKDFNPPSVSDTTFLSWDSSLVQYGATFLPNYNASTRSIDRPREDEYQFCWTPNNNMERSLPYYFTVTAKDKRCPNPGRITRAFSIQVTSLDNIALTKTGINCGIWKLNYVLQPSQQNAVMGTWKIANNPNDTNFANGFSSIPDLNNANPVEYRFTQTGKYYIRFDAQFTDGSASKIYYDSITVDSIVPILNTITTKAIDCYGSNSGQATFKGSKGVAPYQYKIDSQSYSVNNIYTGLKKGQHIVFIKDARGCDNSDTLFFMEPDSLSYSLSVKNISCYDSLDGAITIHAKGGTKPYRYSINDGNTYSGDSTFTKLSSGSRTIMVKDTLGCMRREYATISKPKQIEITGTTKAVSCYGKMDGSVQLHVVGGTLPYLYRLDSGAYVSDTLFSSLSGKVYKCTVKDSNNCILSQSFNLSKLAIKVGSIIGDSILNKNDTQSYNVKWIPSLKYVWGVLNGSITGKQDSNVVKVKWDQSGIGYIYAKASNINNCSDSVYKKITINPTAGLEDITKQWGLKVFPNPTKNILNINLETLPANASEKNIQLFDVQGKLLMQQELKNTQQLNIETLAPGMYILKVGEWSGQVVKE
jgi:hypothetical protein